MDTKELFTIIGQLYVKIALQDEELVRCQRTVQKLEEQIGLLKDHGTGETRISDK
jgi:cell division protein FtsB